jgi:hypothetical protein
MPPTYEQLCERLGFPVPRSYSRFIELTIPDATAEDWEPFRDLPFLNLNNAGASAISISKPANSVIFGWTGCDSEHFIFVMDDEPIDDRERPIAFWPIDGREETGVIAGSFPEFLQYLIGSGADEFMERDERERLHGLVQEEFGLSEVRAAEEIVEAARARRMQQPNIVPTRDNIGLALPPAATDRKYLDSIRWRAFDDRTPPDAQLLDEAERRLAKGELGTAIVIAHNYRFIHWYDDWNSGASIIRRTNDVLASAYQQLGRNLAVAEVERQTEWNLFNVT